MRGAKLMVGNARKESAECSDSVSPKYVQEVMLEPGTILELGSPLADQLQIARGISRTV